MHTFDAIAQRRAVKSYISDFTIPEADVRKLFELTRQAPTSFNLQNYRIVNVQDKALRAQIKGAAWDQTQVTDASMLLVLCANVKAWAEQPERYWENAPPETRDRIVSMIRPFYEGREWLQRDEAMRSVGIVAQTIMLSAKAMGYDTCPMIGFDFDAVAKLVNLPEDHVVGMIVTVGKAAEPAQPKGGYLPDGEVFLTDRF
jgi:nitroreductase